MPREFGDSHATGRETTLSEQCVCVCVTCGRSHHGRLKRKRYSRKTIECTIWCMKRAILRRRLGIATSRCCLLLRCNCCSFECFIALELRAEELDFIIELLSGAVGLGTFRQVVRDRGKCPPLGTRLPVASILLLLMLVRVATFVRFEWRGFMTLGACSEGGRGAVLRPRELLILGSSSNGELLILGSSGRGATIDW